MKTGNVILAIFLWLCIPGSVGVGVAFGLFTGNFMCLIGGPFLFFILGLIALVTGIEKKPNSSSTHPITINQPKHYTNNKNNSEVTKIEKTSGRIFMYNRNELIGGIFFIAFSIFLFIAAFWSEPMIKSPDVPIWFFLAIRILALIFIILGVVVIIVAFLPKKQ